jgi:hypothetical protein
MWKKERKGYKEALLPYIYVRDEKRGDNLSSDLQAGMA